MKKPGYQFALLLCVFTYFFMSFKVGSAYAQDKEYDKSRLFRFEIDSTEQIKTMALKQYKTCPPLRPERFRRRVKMLLGIDIRDYPEDALIWFGPEQLFGAFNLSIKYQILHGEWPGHDGGFIPYDLFDERIYGPLRQYLLFSDTENTMDFLRNYPLEIYNSLKIRYNYDRLEAEQAEFEMLIYYDLLRMVYDCVYSVSPDLITYMDEKSRFESESFAPHAFVYNKRAPFRLSEIKADLVSLYIKEQQNKGRVLTSNKRPKENELWLGCVLDKEWGHNYNIAKIALPYTQNGEEMYPWQMDTRFKGSAGYLAYLLKINDKYTRKTVLLCMSGQLDDNPYLPYGEYEKIRDRIRSNNYYGYAILREFCENSDREMPTLEKLGTSFDASVINSKTLLYLEPYPDSYDIDTIQPSEIFKAYEMGYDDYYFVEVTKPVESPVAGPDGYAMILDRTETVYGYIRKTEIKEISEAEKVSKQITAQSTRKLGKIDDPDGYVNIRKESNADSEIMGKIVDKELFFYWEVPNSNWWYVQTNEEKQGFVHKSRIRGKVDAGSWILDE